MGKRGNRSRNRGQRNQGGQRNQAGPGKQNRGKQPRKKRQIPFDPEKHFMPPTPPEREYDPCEISGEAIEDIVTAIAHPRTGKPVRFESVIKMLLEQENETVGEDERMAYLGRGTFGIVKFEKPDGRGRPELVVRKYFYYEDTHEKYGWRRELAPGISRDYVPNPQPLADLYTAEEISEFPRFEAASSSVISRGT